SIKVLARRLIDITNMPDMAREARAVDSCEPLRGGCSAAACEHEPWNVWSPTEQPLVRVEQRADVLPWFERTQKQDAAVRRNVWPMAECPPPGRTGRTDMDALAGDAKPFDDLRSAVLRGRNDGMRAPRVRGGEGSIIASNLRAR